MRERARGKINLRIKYWSQIIVHSLNDNSIVHAEMLETMQRYTNANFYADVPIGESRP